MTRAMIRLCAVLALGVLMGPGTATGAGESGTDMVFGTGQLENVDTGQSLTYSHTRVAPPGLPGAAGAAAGPAPIVDGRIILSLVPAPDGTGRAALVVLDDGAGRRRTLDPLPGGAEAGNPVLLAFLEMAARSVADATGGSPFYIRNRIKDAFRTGGQTDGAQDVTRIAYRPFVGDPNREALGAFEGLTITFEIAPDTPGAFVRMMASTGGEGPVYHEEIALAGTEAAQ